MSANITPSIEKLQA